VEQELLTLPEHLSSLPVFSGVRVTRSLVLYVCFVDRCLFFCTFRIFNWPVSNAYMTLHLTEYMQWRVSIFVRCRCTMCLPERYFSRINIYKVIYVCMQSYFFIYIIWFRLISRIIFLGLLKFNVSLIVRNTL
jgi:hypothetical protein